MTDEPTLAALPTARDWKELVEYILQDDLHNHLTPRVTDIAFTAWKSGRMGKNTEDGGPCDWFTATKPVVDAAIEKIRNDLKWELAPADDKDATIARLTEERDDLIQAKTNWNIRATDAEAKLAEVTAAGTFAQGIEAAAGEWQNVRVEGGVAVAAVMAYSDRIRALSPTPQADPVREGWTTYSNRQTISVGQKLGELKVYFDPASDDPSDRRNPAMTDISKDAVERLTVRLKEAYGGQLSRDCTDTLRALRAELDRADRLNENLRQMLKNVQSVREHEFQRASAALARVGRLEAALGAIVEEDISRPVAFPWRNDGNPSKMDLCDHRIPMYDECGECIYDFARAALADKGGE